MKESGKRIAAVLLVFMIAMAALPLTASAAAGEYMKVTRNGGQPTGTYAFKLSVKIYNNQAQWPEDTVYWWKNNINHKAPTPSTAFRSYETYYDSKGRLMHKVNITCKNMKGKKLYCKIYDSEGYLVDDWGTDTPARKTNNEVGWFAWSGVANGYRQPSGNYTFVISNSANNKAITKTLWLNIPQGGNG